MASSNGPQALGDVLDEVIERLGIQTQIDKARVVEAWAALAGPQVNSVTDTAWVKRRTLYVKITSAAWRQELHLRRQEWRRRLNKRLGEGLIDEIVFR